MGKYEILPTGREVTFDVTEIIVSKTDLRGNIIYANNVFLKVAGFKESEVLNKPHSIVRHPDMPRCVFKLLWDTISSGEEIFAYVKNMTKTGDHYWVFAHVTPSFDNNKVVGYHSSRRVPDKSAVEKIEPIYKHLLDIENSHSNKKDGMMASYNALLAFCEEKEIEYDELIFSL